MTHRIASVTVGWALGCCVAVAAVGAFPQAAVDRSAVRVTVNTDQADAVMRILQGRAAGGPVAAEEWQALLASEGYRRVMERETALDRQLGIDRGYSDASFREWLESDAALVDLDGRAHVLATWHEVDGEAAGRRALAYLPDSAVLRATIYPTIRKQTNSFVWDVAGNPAIFMHVGADATRAEMESTLAHELHHVGLAGSCSRESDEAPEAQQLIDQWLTGFGEGLAVLAAAGSPDAPTHDPSDQEGQAAWDAGLRRLESDMRSLESFFLDVAAGATRGEEMQRRGMAFVNSPDAPQGAFYTVGWHMAATVERRLGRAALREVICDPAALVVQYNRAAAESSPGAASTPLWTDAFIDLIRDGS